MGLCECVHEHVGWGRDVHAPETIHDLSMLVSGVHVSSQMGTPEAALHTRVCVMLLRQVLPLQAGTG